MRYRVGGEEIFDLDVPSITLGQPFEIQVSRNFAFGGFGAREEATYEFTLTNGNGYNINGRTTGTLYINENMIKK